MFIIAGILIFFELTRRIVNITNPRPGCAISVWLVMLSPFINRKWYYNFSSMISAICAVIFFAYPGAGFLHKYILFEDLYSIVTHSAFFVGSFLIITLKLADFNYKKVKNELISLGVLVGYSLLEMFVLIKNANGDPLEKDPFYAMPNNEIQEIVGMKSYGLYLVLYILFLTLYFSTFYFLNRKKHQQKDA